MHSAFGCYLSFTSKKKKLYVHIHALYINPACTYIHIVIYIYVSINYCEEMARLPAIPIPYSFLLIFGTAFPLHNKITYDFGSQLPSC